MLQLPLPTMALSDMSPESKFGHYALSPSAGLPSGLSPLGAEKFHHMPAYAYSPSHGLNLGAVHGYGENRPLGYPESPRGLSSCMYAGSYSPTMSQTLSPEAYSPSASCSKENDNCRDSPACRRRLDFNHNTFIDVTKVGPMAVAKRNERERNRVKLINTTFQTLRQHLPPHKVGSKGKTRKLSKVQTLRSAIDYIRQLQDMITTKNSPQLRNGSGDQISECPDDHQRALLASMVSVKQEISSLGSEDAPSQEGSSSLHCPSGFRSLMSAYAMKGFVPEHVTSSLREAKMAAGPYASSSHGGSPISDSSYDYVATPNDDEFLDFDDWF